MLTPSLEFWRFKKHPFADAYLRGDTLDLFVGRAEELDDLEDALHNQLTGVFGSRGVGKSTFLQQFAANVEKRGRVVVMVHVPTDAADRLCREVLAAVLTLHAEKRIRTRKSLRLDAAKQLERLEGTVAYRRRSELGASSILKASLSEEHSKQADRLDEAGAGKLLGDVIQHLETPFVVVLDDFHNLDLGDSGGSYFPALERWIRLIDGPFNSDEVSFVLTLDERIEQRSKTAREGGGAFAIDGVAFIPLLSFNPADLREMMERRLSKHGWRGKLEDFITRDAFYGLMLCSEGHPRRALQVLRDAMSLVRKAGGERRIRTADLQAAAAKAQQTLDETDFAIVRYLAEHGSTSASDDGLEAAVGITRTSLRPRLEKLREAKQLTFDKIKVGRTQQAVYALPV